MRFAAFIRTVLVAGLPVSGLAQGADLGIYPGIATCFQELAGQATMPGDAVFSCVQPDLARCLEGPEYGLCVAALTDTIERFNAEVDVDFDEFSLLAQLIAAKELCLDLPEDALAAQCSLSLALGHSGFLLERKLNVRK